MTPAEPVEPAPVAIGLGSNLGPSEAILRDSIRQLAQFLRAPHVGSLFQTSPVPASDQPDFLNTVLLGGALTSPEVLLSIAKQMEWEAGRRPRPRDSARLLDIDLLLWGDRVLRSPELTIPHPRLRTRRFVLAPLAEIAPEFRVPPDGMTVRSLLDSLDDGESVAARPWSSPPL